MRKRTTDITGHLTQDLHLSRCPVSEDAGDPAPAGGARTNPKSRKTVGIDMNNDLGNGPETYGSRRERRGEVVGVIAAIGELGVIGRDSVEARLHLLDLELLRHTLQGRVQS